MNLKEFYIKEYKKLLIIPIIMLIFSIFIIYQTYQNTGDFIYKDVSLKGGTSLTIQTDQEIPDLESFLSQELDTKIIVRTITELGSIKGLVIETPPEINSQDLIQAIETKTGKLNQNQYSIEETGSTLGDAFYKQMILAILIAFILMGIVIFIIFRTLIPSLAVILSAFFDIFITIAIINLLKINISTAGIAALLLLLGYSVDTDVLLTTRLLKRKEGSTIERVFSSIKTGLTMTFTTLVALTAGYFISNSIILKQMFLIIIIGLLVDLVSTWIMNTAILRIYLKNQND